MRPAVFVMLLAGFAAMTTAVLTKSWMDRQTPQAPPVSTQSTTEILVIARDVAAGTALGSDDLRYERWPEHDLTPRMIVRQPDSDPKSQFVGQIARRPLNEGEPLWGASLLRTDALGVLAGMLAPGSRAVSIAITSSSAVSGFVTPGDKVDIVLAADLRNTLDQGSTDKSDVIQRFVAETVLTDIRVLAIDQQIARGRDGGALQGKTATVEVTPKQAEILTAAGMLGQLQLVLRGLPAEKGAEAPTAVPPDGRPSPDANFTGDIESSKALQTMLSPRVIAHHLHSGTSIEVNRAGQISKGTVK
jgi:pilus assembly protein CpaB